MAVQEQSLKSLLSDLIGDINLLLRQELRLARAEASEKVSQLQTGVVTMLAGMLLAFSALLVLLQALVVALSNLMPPSVAAIIVGVVVAAIAVLMMNQGQAKLKASNLVPERTLDSLKTDKNLIAEKVK